MTKWLIVNADDFGRHDAVNRGIIHAHEHGIVTSASLMVRWPAAAEAATYARDHGTLGVGLHVDLGEWVYRDGRWQAVYEVVAMEEVAAVRQELGRQLALFRELVGRDPSHLDSHQHVHRSEPVRSVMRDVTAELGVPLRGESLLVRHCGDFYGQAGRGEPWPEGISTAALVRIVRGLSAGVTELACHPGEGSGGWSAYDSERKLELDALCDQHVSEVIRQEQIRPCNFTVLQSEKSS